MKALWAAYRKVLRVEILFGLGFFAGCFFTGLMVGIGKIH